MVEKVSNTEANMFTVYVQLLEEGTLVYRPVPARKSADGKCIVEGHDIYDQAVETWAFPPGSLVSYEFKKLTDEIVPVVTGLA